MKVLTVIGARPQFIKAAVVSREIRRVNNSSNKQYIREVVINTGQHFDSNMSNIFFEQLDMPSAKYNLNIQNLSHGAMTGRMLEGVEAIVIEEKPDCLMVYGDTNTTLAGALAASKIGVPIVHVEAGLRSHNLKMPEEINRVLTDRISNLLLCPTQSAIKALAKEGYPFQTPSGSFQKIELVGDVMFDLALLAREFSGCENIAIRDILSDKAYVLATIHRQENTNDVLNLKEILSSLSFIGREIKVILPMHPRTLKIIFQNNLQKYLENIVTLDPMPYYEMQRLSMGAKLILTDSGGLQKEALFYGVRCITIRGESEWPETLLGNCNVLVPPDFQKIYAAYSSTVTPDFNVAHLFGNGNAAGKIVSLLHENF